MKYTYKNNIEYTYWADINLNKGRIIFTKSFLKNMIVQMRVNITTHRVIMCRNRLKHKYKQEHIYKKFIL